MDCKMSQENLIDFQFGSLGIDHRTHIEAHLMACPACLQEFFLLKRDVESGHAVAVRPAAEVRAKILREYVRYSYGQVREHPKRYIVGGFVAAAAAVLLLVYSKHDPEPKKTREPAAQVETVRSLDETVDSGGSNPGHINII